jgi:glycosyltransferase involved in cell wall biosynthesis
VRWLLSEAPRLGLVDSPLARPQGISAYVRVKNEEDWIEPSLLSVQAAVDELVVVDNGSTDRTPSILARLQHTLGPKMQVYAQPQLDHVALSNFALARTRYRWVLRWDGDFVAHTTGPQAMAHLRTRLLGLPQHRHYHVHLMCAELLGDLWHQHRGYEVRNDPFVSTFARHLRFVRVSRRVPQSRLVGLATLLRTDPHAVYTFHFEGIKVPLYCRVLIWPEIYHFHVHIDSDLRMYLRDCWNDWMEHPAIQARYRSLEDYALDRARRLLGVQTLADAGREFMRRVCQELVRYDETRWGPLPELLQPYLTHPKYRVRYQDDKPWDRVELPTVGHAPSSRHDEAPQVSG